jgi:hypothetical protein
MGIGDLHFSSRSVSLLDILTERILQRIDEYKPDHVVFFGDTHDRFGQVSTARSRQVGLFFYQVSLRVPFTLLIGNHDIPNKTLFYCEEHDFTAMKFYWKNTTIVDKCIRFKVKGFLFAAVAYCPNGRLLEGLEPAQPLEELTAVFCHQEIRGCMINGIPSSEGDKWSSKWPTIFCGHIHQHHTPQPNVHYVGSPYQDSFGEEDDKSISMLTFEGNSWSEERIYLDLPKKIRLHMTTNEFWEWKPVSPNLYSLTITGSSKECQVVRESEEYKSMTVGGNKCELIHTSQLDIETEPTEATEFQVERRTLKEIVASSIKDKPYLQEIHNLVWNV